MSPRLSSTWKPLSITEFGIFLKKAIRLTQLRFFAFRRRQFEKSQHLLSVLKNESQCSVQKTRFRVEICLISSLQAVFNAVSTPFHHNSCKFGSGNTFFSLSAILDSGSNRVALNSICQMRGRGRFRMSGCKEGIKQLDIYRLSIESACR